jgi:hypothetical protein
MKQEYAYVLDGSYIAMVAINLLSSVGLIVAVVIFLLKLQKLLSEIPTAERCIAPHRVWLLLLIFLQYPIYIGISYSQPDTAFSFFMHTLLFALYVSVLYFNYDVVNKVAKTIENVYDNRGINIEYKPTFQTGLAMVIALGSLLFFRYLEISILNLLGLIAYLICFIAYWITIVKYHKSLKIILMSGDTPSEIFTYVHNNE